MPIAPTESQRQLEQLMVANMPRDALMVLQDAYESGDEKGRIKASLFDQGHRPSAAGQVKHFFLNESFRDALQVHGAEPTPLCGTKLVVGSFGIFKVARINVPSHKWVNLNKSSTRKKLAEMNEAISRKFVQPDLFDEARPIAKGTIFIVGVMDGVDANKIAQLTQVMIALPAPDMKSWIYRSTLSDFLKLYEQDTTEAQIDMAVPRLKVVPKTQNNDDQRN